MSYNWIGVQPLTNPIQTNSNDVILSGHGAFAFNGMTIVPTGVELWLLAPPAASIADSLGQALENRTMINYLGIINPGSNNVIPTQPFIYKAGMSVPNYTLYPPNGIKITPGGPHIICVLGAQQNLSNLWPNVMPFVKPGQSIRVFWAACTAVAGAKNQIVIYQ